MFSMEPRKLIQDMRVVHRIANLLLHCRSLGRETGRRQARERRIRYSLQPQLGGPSLSESQGFIRVAPRAEVEPEIVDERWREVVVFPGHHGVFVRNNVI